MPDRRYLKAALAWSLVMALGLIGPPTPAAGQQPPGASGAAMQPPAALPSGPLNEWVKLGIEGDVQSLAVSPDYPKDGLIFVATVSGVSRSSDGGETWQHIAGSPAGVIRNQGLAISPNISSDGTLFAATRESIHRSTDAGLTWQPVTLGLPLCPTCPTFSSVAISPTFGRDGTVFALAVYGLFRTDNAGERWSSVSGLGGQITATQAGAQHQLVVSPAFADDQTIYALVQNGKRVARSTDGGSTWEVVFEVEDNRPRGDPSYLALSPVYPADGHAFYGTLAGSYYSRDWGGTWTQSNQGRSQTNAGPQLISPGYENDSLVVFAEGFSRRVWASTDSGETWAQVGSGFEEFLQADGNISFAAGWTDPPTLFVGGRGGLARYVGMVPMAPAADEGAATE